MDTFEGGHFLRKVSLQVEKQKTYGIVGLTLKIY